MNEFSGLLIFVGIITTIVVIIFFFIMTSNVTEIKKELIEIRKRVAPDWLDHDFLGQREAYKGKKEEALEHYRNLLFELESGLKDKISYIAFPKGKEYAKSCIEKLEKS